MANISDALIEIERTKYVTGSCEDLNDTDRKFLLMLEHGGDFIGSWFLEDYHESEQWYESLYRNAKSYK